MNTITRPDPVITARWRIIVGLLHDIGPLDIVGRDWVQPTDDGLTFGDLHGRAAQEWVRQLDFIASNTTAPAAPRPGVGQGALKFPWE